MRVIHERKNKQTTKLNEVKTRIIGIMRTQAKHKKTGPRNRQKHWTDMRKKGGVKGKHRSI